MLLKMLAFNCLDNHQQVAKREWQYDIRTEQLVVAWEVEQTNAEKVQVHTKVVGKTWCLDYGSDK